MTAAQDPADEPVDPDDVAEEAPIDPTPQEVEEYRELIGERTPDPEETPEPEPRVEPEPPEA